MIDCARADGRPVLRHAAWHCRIERRNRAFNTMTYRAQRLSAWRIWRFKLAQQRRKKLTSVDKSERAGMSRSYGARW